MLTGSLRSWLSSNYHALLFAGLDRNFMPGHNDYTRFVVLGRPRTGSTFLRSALNGHREIFSFGELFRHELISCESHLGRLSPTLLADYSKRPISFIDERVFRSYPRYIRAVGFKIFYHHAHHEYAKPVWDYLLNERPIRVLHVKRRNLLKTFLSHKIAWLTGEWKQTRVNGQDTAPSISLSYEECEEEFRTVVAQEQAFDLRFADHPCLTLIYEDMVKDFVSEMERIERFLGVSPLVIQPTTVQQAKRPLSQQITNYYDLKERFQQTPWAQFFTE